MAYTYISKRIDYDRLTLKMYVMYVIFLFFSRLKIYNQTSSNR